jgi:hypothetical protein
LIKAFKRCRPAAFFLLLPSPLPKAFGAIKAAAASDSIVAMTAAGVACTELVGGAVASATVGGGKVSDGAV